MFSIFLTTESAIIDKRFFRITRIRPSPGILFTLLNHLLETDSSLKVGQLLLDSLTVIIFWLDRHCVFSSGSMFGISSQSINLAVKLRIHSVFRKLPSTEKYSFNRVAGHYEFEINMNVSVMLLRSGWKFKGINPTLYCEVLFIVPFSVT